MKNLLVFFISSVITFILPLVFISPYGCFTYAYKRSETEFFDINNLNLGPSERASLLQNRINQAPNDQKLDVINEILSMGFSLENALNYVFPNIQSSIDQLCESKQILAIEPTVYAENNNCKIKYKNAKNGLKVNKNAIYCDFYEYLKTQQKFKLKYLEVLPLKNDKQIKDEFVLVSEFKTDFSSSGAARKNNIQVACAAINGQFIKSGEIFSFNKATGIRSEETGYKTAKIIKDGTYIDGVGGGVCQVSTTLYNACLLAGLSIKEVHNHSLPAQYVKPCFDAMVSMGSSDLKIQNNTPNDFIITCCTLNNECKICLYGVKSEFFISTRYEKYEDLPAGEDLIETDVSKYDKEFVSGEHRISYAMDGYRARGYLDYYKDGILIKSEKIRDNTYNPKKGIVLVVE